MVATKQLLGRAHARPTTATVALAIAGVLLCCHVPVDAKLKLSTYTYSHLKNQPLNTERTNVCALRVCAKRRIFMRHPARRQAPRHPCSLCERRACPPKR